MISTAFLTLFTVCFAFLAWQRFHLALAVLFGLLPAYLVRFSVGPLPSTLLEVMVVIVVLCWLARMLRDRAARNEIVKLLNCYIVKVHPSLFLAIGFFLIAATLAMYVSVDLRGAAGEWKAFYVEPVLLFLVLITSLKEKKHINWILSALIFSGLATALFAIYQHHSGGKFVPYAFWENRNTYRVTGWYGFPNAVGMFLAPLLPMALYLLYRMYPAVRFARNKLRPYHWLLFVSCLLFIPSALLAIVYAKSAGAIVGVAGAVGVFLLYSKKLRWPSIVLGVIFLGVLVFAVPIDNPVRQELLMQDRSGQIRVDMWGETSEFLRQHPIEGAGLASYTELMYRLRIDKWIEVFHHPHNLLLTMWVNIGLLGLVGFVWILVWFYRVGITCIMKHATCNKLVLFLLSTMTATVVMGLVDSPYIKNDLSLMFWLWIGLMVIISKQSYEKTSSL